MAPLPANDSEGSKIADLLSLVARLGTQVGALFFSPSGDLGFGLVWDILSTRKTFLIWVSDEKVFYSWKYCLWWSKMIKDDPKVLDGPNVISNESIDFDYRKGFDEPQVFDDTEGISIGSMGINNP